jgi:predicted nucleic acid-binding protein
VVPEVWLEVARIDEGALSHSCLRRVPSVPIIPSVGAYNLDRGEAEALSYAVAEAERGAVLVLCDEIAARRACAALGVPVVGTIGLIAGAYRSGRVGREVAVAALRRLPTDGRLHVAASLMEEAINDLGAP